MTPNTALQRTPPASPLAPLSFKTFGDRIAVWSLLVPTMSLGLAACSSSLPTCRNPVAPVLISSVGLRPPQDFWKTHPDGAVRLEARIGADGKVAFVRVVSTSGPDYSAVAAESVRQWRYAPATCDGVATPTDLTVNIRFSHDEKSD